MCAAAAAILLVLLPCAAPAADVTAEQLARQVGQVFAGYNQFWVWLVQRFTDPDGKTREFEGRVFFKRDKKFRLNFGQPPFLVHGTDGDIYWVYDEAEATIEWSDLNEEAPIHPIFQVFAAADQMVKALDRFFNVESLLETAFEYRDAENKSQSIPAYKLVLSLKQERLKELVEKDGNQLIDKNAKQVWTFWVDRAKHMPLRIQVDWETGGRYVFDLGQRLLKGYDNQPGKFFSPPSLDDRLFDMPQPPGVKRVKRKGG